MGERTDLAGLVAVAFHEPASLQKAEYRYLSAAGTLSRMLDSTRDRMEQQRDAVARALAAQSPTVTG
jgi:DNA-binding transcriptional MocR family regulator